MHKLSLIGISLIILASGSIACSNRPATPKASSLPALPAQEKVLSTMISANRYFMEKYPDVSADSYVRGKYRPSHIWTRSVYYEGLMALHQIFPQASYFQYAYDWGEAHQWGLHRGNTTRNADNQCAGQIYIDLYHICFDPLLVKDIRCCIDMLVNTPQNGDWTWIDAIQMGMPIFAQIGQKTGDKRYYEKAYQMYMHTRDIQGGGLWNAEDGLWWRDADFCPPYKEPNGEDCYWSRGNGWVYVALARYMERAPEDKTHRAQYINDFKSMSKALLACQREDGFWNVSLHDPDHFGGKESSGTALFVCGMAWGIRQGILSEKEYLPAVVKGWQALESSVHPNGFLGYVQGTGKEPKDGQPVGYDIEPDFDDFGLGCFLMAGAEVYKICKE